MRPAKIFLFLATVAIGYWLFLSITSSDSFVREDAENLNQIDSYNPEQIQKVCDDMSPWSYISGLTDGAFLVPLPSGRTYFYKSRCYMELARKTLNPDFCTKVKQRRSIFYDGSSISKDTCLAQIQEGLDRQRIQKAQNLESQAILANAMTITEIRATATSSERWTLDITIKGKLSGTYELEITNGAAEFKDPNKIIKTEQLILGEESATIQYTIKLAQLTSCKGCEPRSKRIYPISVSLTLLRHLNTPSIPGRLLTSTANTTVSYERP